MASKGIDFLGCATPKDGKGTSERTSMLHTRLVEHHEIARDIAKEIAALRSSLVTVDDLDGKKLEKFKRIITALELQVAEIGRAATAAVDYSYQLDQCAISTWVELGIDRPDITELGDDCSAEAHAR